MGFFNLELVFSMHRELDGLEGWQRLEVRREVLARYNRAKLYGMIAIAIAALLLWLLHGVTENRDIRRIFTVLTLVLGALGVGKSNKLLHRWINEAITRVKGMKEPEL